MPKKQPTKKTTKPSTKKKNDDDKFLDELVAQNEKIIANKNTAEEATKKVVTAIPVEEELKTPSDRPIPVTMLSGFLGSGKTSLMKHMLQNREGLRVAVIMNEITEENIDVMALEGSKIMQSEEKVVEMSNGCICCTLREDLLLQLRELSRSKKYDAVLIESSGIAEPMQVAETFFVDTNDGNPPLNKEAPLDNCVTVIDASVMLEHIASLDAVSKLDPSKADADEGAADIAGLLFSQLEFANIVLLNKVDLLGSDSTEHQQHIDELVALVKKINPYAEVVPTQHSQTPMSKILRTGNFSLAFAQKTQNWMEDIKSGVKHVPETLEYGVSSFFFDINRPFHPKRLFEWMERNFMVKQVVMEDPAEMMGIEANARPEVFEDESKGGMSVFKANAAKERSERYGHVFRSKGFVWIAGNERAKHIAQWSQAGSIITFQHCGVLDGRMLPGQKLAFIGQNLKHDALREDMNALLLTDDEYNLMRADNRAGKEGTFEDPFAPFPNSRLFLPQ